MTGADRSPERPGERDDRARRVDEVVAHYLDRLNAGEPVDALDVFEAHPDSAEEVLEELYTFAQLGQKNGDENEPLGTLGDYTLRRQIGRGGMGVVYEAWENSLERRVAVKVLPTTLGLSKSTIQRFHREAIAMAKLHHTNIVAIHAEGQERGVCYYVMELIEGEGLDRVIARMREEGPTPLIAPDRKKNVSSESTSSSHFDSIASLMADIADALDYAHSHGVIHRDIKPSNLMLDRDGRLKLMDFGLARMLEQPGVTVSGDLLGTPAYMSPEQIAAGRVEVDHRTDIYSLGTTLYEFMTLQSPFSGGSREQVMSRIVNKEPKRPRQIDRRIPVDLETICLKAMEKDADCRYQTGRELAVDLRRYERRYVVLAKRQGLLRRAGKFLRRHRTASTASLVVFLLAAVSSVVVWSHWPERRLVLTELRRLSSDAGLTTEPDISASGEFVVYASDRSGEDQLDIYRQSLAPGGKVRRLTVHSRDDRAPSISPDRATVAFRSDRDGGGIYVMPTEDGEAAGVRHLVDGGNDPRHSPDGEWIACWVGAATSANLGKVCLVRATDGELRWMAPDFAVARYPMWTPDGRWIVVLGRRDESWLIDRRADWWALPVDGGLPIRTRAGESLGRGFRFWDLRQTARGAWLQDGSGIVAPIRRGDARDLHFIPFSSPTKAEPDRARVLAPGGERGVFPRVQASDRLVFAKVRLVIDLWSLPVDAKSGEATGPMKRITNDIAASIQPTLSADGKSLVYVSERDGRRDVWRMNLESGEERRLTDTPEGESSPSIAPDGSQLAFSCYSDMSIRVADLATGDTKSISSSIRLPMGWLVEGNGVVDSGGTVHALESSRKSRLVDDGGRGDIVCCRLSPDQEWLTFFERQDSRRRQIFVAPVRWPEEVKRREWIAITDDSTLVDDPSWSPSGNVIYFTSDRGGYDCIYAQRLDPRSKKPRGRAIEVQHFDSARLSLSNVPRGDTCLAVGHERLIFPLGEVTGNLWSARLARRY